WLVQKGFRTVSLHDLVESRRTRTPLPEGAVILTFDDGKSDALQVVLPSLRKRGMHATFFIITGLVGQPGYLSWDGVRALAAAGMEIGSHTVSHPRFPDLSEQAVRDELVQSKSELEAHLGAPVEFFAWPFNACRRYLRKAVTEAGYRGAVAGAVHGGSHMLQLERIPVKHDTALEEFQRAVLR